MKKLQKQGGQFSKGKAVRWLIIILVSILFIIFTVKLNQVDKTELVSRKGQTFEKATVTKVLEDNLQEDGSRVGEQRVMVKMDTGEKKGQELAVTSSSGYLFGAGCKEGMHVVVMQSVAGESVIASVYTQDREWVMYLFAALYILLLCVVGGKQGMKGSAGLIFTFFCVIFVYLPMVYRKVSLVLDGSFVCVITTIVTLPSDQWWASKNSGISSGNNCGSSLRRNFCSDIQHSVGLTRYNVSDIESLLTLWNTNGIQVGGLLFSGLLISSLGAVMDVAMSVSSSMAEILKQNPELTRKELFKAGIQVGRDMMGTDSNTLILAFAGSSVSTLLLDCQYDLPYRQIINSNKI